VRDFGVKLNAEGRPLLVLERADRIAFAFGGDPIALGRLLNVVAVTHPGSDRLAGGESGEQSHGLQDFHLGSTVLAAVSADYLSTLNVCYELHTVADAEYGGDVEDGGIGERHIVAVHRVGASTQDDARWFPLSDPFHGSTWRVDLGIHARLANATGDQLREL
jgi:hypothetical protein